jgi:hypothetical protein
MKHSMVSCLHKLRKHRKNYILIQEYLHNYLPRRTDYQRPVRTLTAPNHLTKKGALPGKPLHIVSHLHRTKQKIP